MTHRPFVITEFSWLSNGSIGYAGHFVEPIALPRVKRYPPGVACEHPGCLHHISHSCEGCGRIGGRYPGDANDNFEG